MNFLPMKSMMNSAIFSSEIIKSVCANTPWYYMLEHSDSRFNTIFQNRKNREFGNKIYSQSYLHSL